MTKGVKATAGVKEHEVAADWKSITVTFDKRNEGLQKVLKALADAGYPATVG